MELLNFLKTLKRRSAILILVPLITVAVSWVVVSNLPDKYVSHTRLATGLADRSLQLENSDGQDSRINQEFGNITQMIQLNKIVDQVSYELMLHDLQSEVPFGKLSKDVKELNASERTSLVAKLQEKSEKQQELLLWDPQEKKVDQLLQSMKYDNESLKEKLKVFRVENSDFVNMEFESHNPQLSAFVLNTLSKEFIHYYTTAISENKTRTVTFLDSLLQTKQAVLAMRMEELKNYKINNRVLNLEEQSRSVFSQMADISLRKGVAQKDVVAYNAALRGIDNHFDPKDRRYLESRVSGINQEIVHTKQHLKDLNEAYVKSDFDPRYKAQMDSIQTKLTSQIYDQTDQYAYNPLTTKENLVNQKINLEVSRDLAKNSVASLNNELGRVNQGLDRMVPNVANIQALEANLEVANKEYLDVLEKYNQASLEASYTLPVRQVEKAMPENAEPDKKPLLVALSGVMSFILCVLVLFIIFFFDRSVYSSEQLEAATGLPVIGSLNLVHGKQFDLQSVWNETHGEADKVIFKNLLRSARYEIEKGMQDKKVIAITSFRDGAGKTFATTSLAYAFSKMNKKVLIIDGNFANPDISNSLQEPKYLESYLLNSGQPSSENFATSILGNKGGDCSILELTNQQTLERIFDRFKAMYDIILIETSSIESLNQATAKEWILFADKVVVVYEAGAPLEDSMSGDIKYLQELDDKFYGFILNKVPGLVTDKALVSKRQYKEKPAKHGRMINDVNIRKGRLKPTV